MHLIIFCGGWQGLWVGGPNLEKKNWSLALIMSGIIVVNPIWRQLQSQWTKSGKTSKFFFSMIFLFLISYTLLRFSNGTLILSRISTLCTQYFHDIPLYDLGLLGVNGKLILARITLCAYYIHTIPLYGPEILGIFNYLHRK